MRAYLCNKICKHVFELILAVITLSSDNVNSQMRVDDIGYNWINDDESRSINGRSWGVETRGSK